MLVSSPRIDFSTRLQLNCARDIDLTIRPQGPAGCGTIIFFADRFARRGIAALVYDKRGQELRPEIGRPRDTKTSPDALAGIHLLQHRKDIYPDRTGVFGHSEGGAVVAIKRRQHVMPEPQPNCFGS